MIVWTIGHSTLAIDAFVNELRARGIRTLVDIRRFPGSRTHPQFGRDALAASLGAAGIGYEHLEALGGRRRARADSPNVAWRDPGFRGYADYMETPEFAAGAAELLGVARERGPVAILCAESQWWRCHRGLVSDWLEARGVEVRHAWAGGRDERHPFTEPARLLGGRVVYCDVPGSSRARNERTSG